MFKSFLIIFCSVYMVLSVGEIHAAKGKKKESSAPKEKARYSFKKGKKNQKYIDEIRKRGGLSYPSFF